jgi:hypothetical protein
MKKLLIAGLLLVGMAGVSEAGKKKGYGYGDYGTGSNSQSETVGGYTRRDGTYVGPYQRTKANNTDDDNYSTRGNYNPWTGKTGTKRNEDD